MVMFLDVIHITLILLSTAFIIACGTDAANNVGVHPDPKGVDTARTDTSGACKVLPCDASSPTVPVVTASGGSGDVTTYGGVGNATPSSGGACNYGITGITHYAAIQVNQMPGDLRGQWQEGRACGQCVRIRARTSSGWKTTVARIVDKCPDANCGIDLGGAPATEIMGTQPGRYSGEWSFVPCQGLSGVTEGPKALWVKDGSNAYWSLVQVRNAPSGVDSILARIPDGPWTPFTWATEAENFFKVPANLLQAPGKIEIRIVYRMAGPDTLQLEASSLAIAGANYKLE